MRAPSSQNDMSFHGTHQNDARILDLIGRRTETGTVFQEIIRWMKQQIPAASCRIVLVQDRKSYGDPVALPESSPAGLTAQFQSVTHPIETYNGTCLGTVSMSFASETPADVQQLYVAEHAARLATLALDQRELLSALEQQARYDALTGLANRVYFRQRLAEILGEANGRPLKYGVFFLDLDRFKQVNDSYGHAAGDQVLSTVGRRLAAIMGSSGLAARFGGDEFAAVVPATDGFEGLMQIGHAIVEALRAPHRINGREVVVTCSAGCSIYPDHGDDVGELLSAADTAMYAIKKSGKNGFQFSIRAEDLGGRTRLELEGALESALENGQFELLYQPLVTIHGRLAGAEALLSWHVPGHGRVAPKHFIPIAEETGLIIPIGTWVLQRACADAGRWLRSGFANVAVSVNVSALQFERADFIDLVAASLAQSGLPAACLELELTESLVMRDAEDAAARMRKLRDLGVRIAIDDFGTGYSSLSYLSKLPVDSLKIDQSFLRGIHDLSGALPVVQTIVRLAHSLNLQVIAEGVETQQELDLLRVIGCDKVQGHLYGYSLPENKIAELFARAEGQTPFPTQGDVCTVRVP